MLNTLKDLFDSFAGPAPPPPGPAGEHAVRLAAAVLLVEVMRADTSHTAAERTAVVSGLRDRFGLSSDELARLLELAEAQAKDAYDYHRFTSLLNERFSQPQKIALVEAMWQIAYADAHLDANENHLISKVAGLLHVTHGEYIAAKLHAKEASRPDPAAG